MQGDVGEFKSQIPWVLFIRQPCGSVGTVDVLLPRPQSIEEIHHSTRAWVVKGGECRRYGCVFQ